jgi:hypothetical protein
LEWGEIMSTWSLVSFSFSFSFSFSLLNQIWRSLGRLSCVLVYTEQSKALIMGYIHKLTFASTSQIIVLFIHRDNHILFSYVYFLSESQ